MSNGYDFASPDDSYTSDVGPADIGSSGGGFNFGGLLSGISSLGRTALESYRTYTGQSDAGQVSPSPPPVAQPSQGFALSKTTWLIIGGIALLVIILFAVKK